MTAVDTARRVVVFRLGASRYALDVAVVERVVRYVEPRELALRSADVEGVVEVDGQLVPLVDLRRRLAGGVTPADAQTRILLARIAAELVGFVVDQVLDVRACQPSELTPPPPLVSPGAGTPVYVGTFRRGSDLVMLVDAVALLDAARSAPQGAA